MGYEKSIILTFGLSLLAGCRSDSTTFSNGTGGAFGGSSGGTGGTGGVSVGGTAATAASSSATGGASIGGASIGGAGGTSIGGSGGTSIGGAGGTSISGAGGVVAGGSASLQNAMAGAAGDSSGAPASSGAGGASGAHTVTCLRPAGMPAVTLSYDDALPTQLSVAAPSLKKHGLKATFFLLNVTSNPAPWAALRADGHELAAHTFTHACPKAESWVTPGNASEDFDLTRMAGELDQGLAMLAALGQPAPYTFAYPCGITWVGAAHQSYIPLVQQRFAAARDVVPGAVQAGVDLYDVPATFSTGTGAELIAIAQQAKAQPSWVVFGFHGIGGDSNVIAADAHEALLTYLEQQHGSIYVATFGELAACFAP